MQVSGARLWRAPDGAMRAALASVPSRIAELDSGNGRPDRSRSAPLKQGGYGFVEIEKGTAYYRPQYFGIDI